jgi:thymidylate synthase
LDPNRTPRRGAGTLSGLLPAPGRAFRRSCERVAAPLSQTMKQYLDLVRTVLDHGGWQTNRTGIRTLSFPGAMLRFDLQEGFPAITTRRLAFRAAVGELVGFLRASRDAAEFRALGCKVWDQNANENAQWLANPYRRGEDDLGEVYGRQWRQWPAHKVLDAQAAGQVADAQLRGYRVVTRFVEDGVERVLLYKAVDQLRQCLDTIVSNPSDRRILFHGWNPAQLDEMALPPCHLLYQFLPNADKREISLCLYIRSNDIGLGTPFNLAEGAALLHLVGRLTGYAPRWFSYFIGDAHIYETHLDMLREQLERAPLPAPRLQLSTRIPDYASTGVYAPEWLERVEPGDFSLKNYRHHGVLSAPMAV